VTHHIRFIIIIIIMLLESVWEKCRAYPEFELAASVHNGGSFALRAIQDCSICTLKRVITFSNVS